MTTSFDEVFEQLEAPEHPATCDDCGLVGTNASMVGHDCDDVVQYDACGAVVLREEARTGIPAAEVEGAFCPACRG